MKRTQENNVVLDKDYRLWALLRQASHVLGRQREQELRKFGVTMMKAAVLNILRTAKEPPTISEISRMVLREPHTMGRLVYRMKEQGLVKIENDSERKNLKRITMTDKGRKITEQTIEMTRIKKSLSCLSEEERGKLRGYLRKLRNEALDEMGIRHRFPYTYPPGSPQRKQV